MCGWSDRYSRRIKFSWNLPSERTEAQLHLDFVLDNNSEILALRGIHHTAERCNYSLIF